MNKFNVLTVCGTRPEIIKMAPVVQALKKREGINSQFLLSGQHTSLAWETYTSFGLRVDYRIKLQRKGTSLADLHSELLYQLNGTLQDLRPGADLILVHGDTTTALAAAEAAFYNRIPIGHVEAGLRTSRYEYPWPEETNRRLISKLAKWHFAPTEQAKRNLWQENIIDNVYVTGNTVVDALNSILGDSPFTQKYVGWCNKLPLGKRVILVTCHRRESWGAPLEKLCKTLKSLLIGHDDYLVIWPVHPNKIINDAVAKTFADFPKDQIKLHGNIEYNDFISLLNVVDVVITDSGGVMEEAAVLGTPCLVLRNDTERPEALELPNVELIGYDFGLLKRKVNQILKEVGQARRRSKIFGEGHAGEMIADIIEANCFKEKRD